MAGAGAMGSRWERGIQEGHTWFLPQDAPPELLGRKKVDWSTFEHDTTTIPHQIYRRFVAVNGEDLERGERKPCTFIFSGSKFSGLIGHVAQGDRRIGSKQLFFGRELKVLLRESFGHSYGLIASEREARQARGDGRGAVILEPGDAEYIDFFATGNPYEYRIEFLTLGEQRRRETGKPTASSFKELVPALYEYVSSRGFSYPKDDFYAFCTALRTKPFIILAGISGTGKTRLPLLLAEAFGVPARVISVRPDWTDSADLLGYVDIHGRFQPGAFLAACRHGIENPDEPVFVCLDEMNLARVEHYFAEVLSAIERRRWDGDRIRSGALLQVAGPSADEWSGIYIPDNMFIVGTVNMDETTHPFSRKVLDRAFTIEFNDYELAYERPAPLPDDWEALDWRSLNPVAIRLADLYDTAPELFDGIIRDIESLNQFLRPGMFQVAYRVRDEICLFVKHALDLGWTRAAAFDQQVLMKILPRIQGSSSVVRRTLISLWNWSTGDAAAADSDADDLSSTAVDAAAPFPRTAKRVKSMISRLDADGYTSYWV